MSTQLKSVTDQSFKSEVLSSPTPVLVDFGAAWCAPCKALTPKLESLSQTYQGRVQIVTVDVDTNQESPARYRVRGLPTLILFQNGQVVGQLSGNQPKEAIESLFKNLKSF